MRAVLQRVTQASVEVEGVVTGAIGKGILILLGVGRQDTEADAEYLADRILRLRIFSDQAGKMNLSVREAGGSVLVVSQFTLYGDCRKGLRPSFDLAAPPAQAKSLYESFVASCRKRDMMVETGVFQAAMAVRLVNDGPVTLIVESKKTAGNEQTA
jgi:D-tyrosyl-tRNA(Tyr) deacylase